MSRWTVKMTAKAEAELKRLVKEKKIKKSDIVVITKWVDSMEEFGPDFIHASPEWHDHELHTQWIGYRSSAFSSSGRIIYRVLEKIVVVEVHKITPNHNYKRMLK